MTDENIAEVLVGTTLITVILLAVWYGRRIPNWGAIPDGFSLPRDADGAAIVPVSMLMLRRIMGATTNGISPKLWLTATGLRFKIFILAERPFSDFTHVEAHKALLHGTRLIFVGRGQKLHVLIPDRRAARAVLRLLPPDLPLTPAAVALRGQT